MEDALDRIGYSPEQVTAFIASIAMDPPIGAGWQSTVIPRAGIHDMVEVLIQGEDELGKYVVICDGYLSLQADTEDGARENWPYECLPIITGQPPGVLS